MAIPAKPKFPNAKTYKDKQGNIREVGTGRLIRRAPAPKKPKTFIDGQGVVRQVGTASGGRPAVATNPLERQVDSSILAQTAPLNNRIGDTNAQFGAEQSAIQNAGTALGSELQALQDRIAGLGAQQLGAAASAAGGTADQQAANLSYLQSILGSKMSDSSGLPGAVTALAAQAQGEGAGAAANIALGQRGAQNELGTIGGASALQRQATIEERMRGRDAALRDYNDQIAAIKANRQQIKNDLINQSLDQQAARQQIRLAQAEFDHGVEMDNANLDLQQQQLDDASAAAAAETRGAGGVYGLGESADSLVAAAIGHWKKGRKTYAALLDELIGTGAMTAADAARIANKTMGLGDIRSNGAASVVAALRKQGVPKAQQKNIIRNVFGQAMVERYFGGTYDYGNGILAPGNQRPSPGSHAQTSMAQSANKLRNYLTKHVTNVRKGQEITVDGKKWTVISVSSSLSGALKFVVRDPSGNRLTLNG